MISFQDFSETQKAWQEFVETGNILPELRVRKEIMASWKRCRQVVEPFGRPEAKNIPANRFQQVERNKQELIDIAFPIMQNLFKFVAGSGFVVVLMDQEGCLLRVLGAPELMTSHRSYFNLGAYWLEEEMGTNAVGLALRLKKPIQVYAWEHYCSNFHKLTCSAAPIHDPSTNEIIGVLDMSGNYKLVHDHTLGMIVAAANAIENQIALRRAWRASFLADQYKSIIMESMNDGVITVDCDGIITHINLRGQKMLQLNTEKLVGNHVEKVMSEKPYHQLVQVLRGQREVTDEIINLHFSKNMVRYTVTCRFLATNEETLGIVAILQELSRVKRLIDRVYGNTARYTFDQIVGNNPNFRNALKLAEIAASNPCNVLVLGESGTGKDILAQAIHNASSRTSEPFVALNCAAINKELLGSELFGYEEGAFTGAKKGGNPGKFELANGGTLFLDEIGEMPLEMQTYLLRVLEENAVMRIGGRNLISVDVRIIAATNKHLIQEVENGNFRRDLFYRLNVMTITLPCLRDRLDDIPMLVEYLAEMICSRLGKKFTGVDSKVIDLFMAHKWTGNVRELQNVIERAIYLAGDVVRLSLDLLPMEMREQHVSPDQSEISGEDKTLTNVEKATILAYMDKFNGNRTEVAKHLGIARSTLYRKLSKYNISNF